ncbi:hypothetical protein HPB52_019784 [Rhipicephalus sanguineus]|uniref:Uncharacterized protein n=1 Tax=Rhipicephalus sanguineus TaxID=34632 RepID=A0A9D4PP84_RHISA|nr:hypothetical protein HPB52_019784 [Rhipicephalus sanguineus]
MEHTKNKRASRRSQSTRIVNEVNRRIQSEHRLRAVKTQLAALNAELETLMTDEQWQKTTISSWNMMTNTLAMLKHHIDMLKASPPTLTAHLRATTDGHRPATSEREPSLNFCAWTAA